ncbi:MAG: type II toxin-antitoxin system Phd/YefM family antitoxin [Pseudomonadota bacterium]
MKHWPVQDAKARFSELLRASLEEGPQMVTLRGRDAAVLVPADEWRKLSTARPRSLKDVLLASEPRGDIELPDRRGYRLREIGFED